MGNNVEIKPTAAETATAEAAASDFNDFVTRFVPAARKLKDLVAATPNARARLGGRVSSAVAKQAAFRRGKTAVGGARQIFARASGVAQGANSVDESLVSRQRKGLQKLVAFGRGVRFDANTSLGRAAQQATGAAIDATRARLAADSAEQGAIAQGLGILAGGFAASRRLGEEPGFPPTPPPTPKTTVTE